MPGYSLDRAAALLEWPRVAARLAELANSEPGLALCRELPFYDNPEAIKQVVAEVGEARELLERGVNVEFADVVELGPIAKRARVGATLDGQDLRIAAGLMRAARRIKAALEKENVRLPRLGARAALLPDHGSLEKEIFAKIAADGSVADTASNDLLSLRERYRVAHAQIHTVLDSILGDPRYEDVLQENIFTLRAGRYVLLVKHERRGSVEGIVHDISKTGQSLFIEPREVTGLNNRLRTAELEIEREIYRVLLELTYKVGAVVDELEQSVVALADLDVVFAKARYAQLLDAHPVEPIKSGAIHLEGVRHPLLVEQLEVVVPNDMILDDVRTLVISGPNTGGKTVFIKTLGLCALMLRAGLHLPCKPDGRLPIFKRLFAVIGDEQSLEKNLSSFSSHVLNLKDIVTELVPNSLVLIDEIGEGTDPAQGTALAKAVLEYLDDHRARTVITTHFVELMAMAQTHEGFANAAMTFDAESMTPTFHLIAGAPGRSSAFATAERLGLPAAIVARAREFAIGQNTELDVIIQQLENERAKLEALIRKTETARQQAEADKEKQHAILEDLHAKKTKMAETERAKLQEELKMARVTIKNIIRQLQEQPTFKEAEVAREQLEKVVKQTETILPLPAEQPLPEFLDEIADWSTLAAGDEVFVRRLNTPATILDLPDAKGRVRLQVRDKRMTLPAAECFRRQPLAGKVPPAPSYELKAAPATSDEVVDPRTAANEIDLRGMTGDEALAATEAFLDEALRKHLRQVYIIHGHGTGVLKRLVRDYLTACPYAHTWRPGKRGEGSDGVTVVELDL